MERPWLKNAPNLLIVNAIFAALAGLALGLVFQDADLRGGGRWIWPVVFFGFSFMMFAWTAERITDAIDEGNAKKHIAHMVPYNLGVISLIAGVLAFVRIRYAVSLWYALIIPGLSIPWLSDLWWLLTAPPADFDRYRAGLSGERQPEVYPTWWNSLFYKIRALADRLRCSPEHGSGGFPHDGVYTRLGVSRIHGVGVFAIKDIPTGTRMFEGDDANIVWVTKEDIGQVEGPVKQLYDDFCIIKGSRYGCPTNFNKLTISWYLNESKAPNVKCDADYEFYAARDITGGEELTVDYATFSEYPEGAQMASSKTTVSSLT